MNLKVLVGCEYSGVVRDAFTALGHDATSCDFIPSETPGPHHQGDVMDIIDDEWDLAIFHPPCTFLCSSGLHWNKKMPIRQGETDRAILFVKALMDAPIPHIALENPIGCLSTQYRKPNQIIQPWQFGHDASKATCLWLKDLPPLVPTQIIPPTRFVNGKGRYSNQTNSGQNRLGPGPDRWKDRSRTYEGIAKAMAEQWSKHIIRKVKIHEELKKLR